MNPDPTATDAEMRQVALSPSLQREGHAYEMKFVVDAATVAKVVEWARKNMAPDPFAKTAPADGYLINTVYLDTPTFSTFFSDPYFRCRKFRLRRYGQEPVVWLEQKRKNKMRVRKRRVSVSDSLLIDRLTKSIDPDWDGAWFGQRLQTRQLQPVCRVSYRRLAFVGVTSTGPIRLTVDRQLGANPCSEWQFCSEPAEDVRLLPDHQILELKFRDVLPLVFRGLIEELRLIPGAFSKYRQSAAAVIPHLVNGRSETKHLSETRHADVA